MAVRRAVGGIAVGGEAAIAGSRLAGWLGRTMARPYSVAVCSVAAVRRTGGSGAGRVSAVGLVARSHQGATLQCGGETVRHCGGGEAVGL